MKKTFFITLLSCIILQMTFAQSFDKARLDNYFKLLEENHKFMGSVAVSKDGAIIYTKSVGYADVENNIKADESTKYRVGSISKTFTAVLILKAVEENKLNLDQTIDQYFPTIENADKITVKHLLNHRSGIHNFTDDADYLSWNTQPKTAQEMIGIITNAGSDFEPDSKAQYSNSNYLLLTYILEKVHQQSYTELLKERITLPLSLKDTYLGGKINTRQHESKSYRFVGNWQAESETDISIPLGAGGIVTTPADLVKFSDALFGGKLLKNESQELMKTIRDHYGIGLFQLPFDNKVGYGHTGGIDGFTAIFAHFTDGNISYALTSNGTNFNNNDISIAVLSAVYNKAYELPDFSGYEVSSAELDSYIGVYASEQIPLKITISKNNQILVAQATGQSAFPLEATSKNIFKFDPAGIVMEFNSTAKTMLLKQGGGQFIFTKE
jgi:D-alanyl-D-alanine carboxypeptidase